MKLNQKQEPESSSYFKFFIKFMGYTIYHKAEKLYKNEAFAMVQADPRVFDDIVNQQSGFRLINKSGWENGIITNPKILKQ